MSKKAIIEKIAKCLRLAESDNAHEASIALKRAHQLMKKHQIEEGDLGLANIEEKTIILKGRIFFWQRIILSICAKAFECYGFNSWTTGNRRMHTLVGVGIAPELAVYAYHVLVRQLEKALETRKKSSVYRNLDTNAKKKFSRIFSESWAFEAKRELEKFASNYLDKNIMAYIEQKHGKLRSRYSKSTGYTETPENLEAQRSGAEEGRKAKINHGVNNTKQYQLN